MGYSPAVATIRTVAVAPFVSVPREQVTTPELLVQVPWLEAALTNVKPAGNVLVT